jgi:hypothetical protein
MLDFFGAINLDMVQNNLTAPPRDPRPARACFLSAAFYFGQFRRRKA